MTPPRHLVAVWNPAYSSDAMDAHLATLLDGAPEILDYKSHDLAPGDESGAAEGYTLQAELYATALSELLGTAPAAFRFLFPKTGGEVRLDLPPERIADFRERLADLLRTVAQAG